MSFYTNNSKKITKTLFCKFKFFLFVKCRLKSDGTYSVLFGLQNYVRSQIFRPLHPFFNWAEILVKCPLKSQCYIE